MRRKKQEPRATRLNERREPRLTPDSSRLTLSHYDPLTATAAGTGLDYMPSYWTATAGAAPPDDGALSGTIDVDVAIIGGGYTGLSCAYHLARDYGIGAAVLEANR